MNGVEPHAYRRATLEAIAAGHTAARIDERLPWAFARKPLNCRERQALRLPRNPLFAVDRP